MRLSSSGQRSLINAWPKRGRRWKTSNVDVTDFVCMVWHEIELEILRTSLQKLYFFIYYEIHSVEMIQELPQHRTYGHPLPPDCLDYITDGDSEEWCLKEKHWILFSSFANFQYLEIRRSGLRHPLKNLWATSRGSHKSLRSDLTACLSVSACDSQTQASGPNSILTWSHRPYNG